MAKASKKGRGGNPKPVAAETQTPTEADTDKAPAEGEGAVPPAEGEGAGAETEQNTAPATDGGESGASATDAQPPAESDAGGDTEDGGDENAPPQGDVQPTEAAAPAPEPEPAPAAEQPAPAPKAAAPKDDTVARMDQLLAKYQDIMSRRIIPQEALKEGASLLQIVTQLVIESGSKAACDRMFAFHKEHLHTLMAENKALRGTHNLPAPWMNRVEAVYHVFRSAATGRNVAIDETRFIGMFNYSPKAKPHLVIDYIGKKAKSASK